jgi:crotonobetainyl-CoA:carnitine CoA-transferase CaiB-like acyl-CoA transferase
MQIQIRARLNHRAASNERSFQCLASNLSLQLSAICYVKNSSSGRYAIGHALAALIKRNDSGKGAETPQELSVTWQFVIVLHMRDQGGQDDQIDIATRHHLIGNADIAAFRVFSFGQSVSHFVAP